MRFIFLLILHIISLIFLIKDKYLSETDLSVKVIVLLISLEILLSLENIVIAFKLSSRAATLQFLEISLVDSGDYASL